MTQEEQNSNFRAFLLLLLAFVILVFILYFASGCMTSKRIEKFKAIYCAGNKEIKKDSSSITETNYELQDTSIYFTANILRKALIECQNNKPVILKKDSTVSNVENSNIDISINGNDLIVNCKIDSAKIAFQWNEKHTKTTITVNDSEKEKIQITTNILTPGQHRMITFALVCIGIFSLLIIYAGYRVYRYFRNKSISLKNYIQKIK